MHFNTCERSSSIATPSITTTSVNMQMLKRFMCKRRTTFLVLILSSAIAAMVVLNSQRFVSFVRSPANSRSEISQNVTKADKVTPTGGIPKIIHQIWNDDVIPEVFQGNIKGLVTHNKYPEWQYYFWTAETGDQFVKNYFPDLFHRFSTARGPLRANILRLAVLYHYGGVYFDLDTASVKPLDPYVETHDCSFTTDPPEHFLRYHYNSPKLGKIVTNCVILCKPGNWFVWHILELIINQSETCTDSIKCTGPDFITAEWEKMESTTRSSDLPLLETSHLFTDKLALQDVEISVTSRCKTILAQQNNDWRKEVCKEFVRRGGAARNISEKAYSYHQWFHTTLHQKELKQGTSRRVRELVPHAFLYK